MTSHDSGLRAFGGAPLADGGPVRFAHIDEAGTSKAEFCVVAGVVSAPDAQWRTLNDHLGALADAMVPIEDREGIIFHATDIFHGSGKFRRDKWPKHKRFELLTRLAMIPSNFSLPVISGLVEKSKMNWGDLPKSPRDLEAYNYSLAFGLCVTHFEYVLRDMCGPDELGTIIAEDNRDMRQYARQAYQLLSDPNKWAPEGTELHKYQPLRKVIEQPHFTEKTGSGILQIADTIAFVLARRLNGGEDTKWLFDLIAPQLVILPHQRGEP